MRNLLCLPVWVKQLLDLDFAVDEIEEKRLIIAKDTRCTTGDHGDGRVRVEVYIRFSAVILVKSVDEREFIVDLC